MQIRSQYLIQDNHNDYTSEPPFSRACICLLSCTHVCIPSPDTRSPPFFCGTHAYPFRPPAPSVPSRASARSCTVGSWKCLDAPRRSAGSRGKNATLLIIKYARDGAQERRAEGREGTVCTLYTNVQCGLEVLAKRLTMVAMKRFQREEL